MNRASLDPSQEWRPPSPRPNDRIGDRVLLRYWVPADAPLMFDALAVDRQSFLPWLPWTEHDNRTVEECHAAIIRMHAKRESPHPEADDFTLGIFDRHSGVALGGTGLHRVNFLTNEAEIGYWIRADRRRQRLCSEAVALLISWAFEDASTGGWGLRRITIRCASRNVASQFVPRTLGLHQEATLASERWSEATGWDDTLVWGVMNSKEKAEFSGDDPAR